MYQSVSVAHTYAGALVEWDTFQLDTRKGHFSVGGIV
jgi:hypothetical protein